jgi:hypothetical protein
MVWCGVVRYVLDVGRRNLIFDDFDGSHVFGGVMWHMSGRVYAMARLIFARIEDGLLVGIYPVCWV